MKKVLLFHAVFSVFLVFSQKTVQFSDPLPFGSPSVGTTDKIHFGQYENTESGVTYHIDESGISIVTLVVSYVTRDQIRESSKLMVRGNYLHGIVANDSVYCTLEDDRYYYGIEQHLPVIGDGSLNSLTKLSANKYVINFHEGLYFEPSLVSFENGNMVIIHGDLTNQPAFESILKTGTITRYGAEVSILTPTYEQWERLQNLLFTGEKLRYIRLK